MTDLLLPFFSPLPPAEDNADRLSVQRIHAISLKTPSTRVSTRFSSHLKDRGSFSKNPEDSDLSKRNTPARQLSNDSLDEDVKPVNLAGAFAKEAEESAQKHKKTSVSRTPALKQWSRPESRGNEPPRSSALADVLNVSDYDTSRIQSRRTTPQKSSEARLWNTPAAVDRQKDRPSYTRRASAARSAYSASAATTSSFSSPPLGKSAPPSSASFDPSDPSKASKASNTREEGASTQFLPRDKNKIVIFSARFFLSSALFL